MAGMIISTHHPSATTAIHVQMMQAKRSVWVERRFTLWAPQAGHAPGDSLSVVRA